MVTASEAFGAQGLALAITPADSEFFCAVEIIRGTLNGVVAGIEPDGHWKYDSEECG
jgi:hypothetical protein